MNNLYRLDSNGLVLYKYKKRIIVHKKVCPNFSDKSMYINTLGSVVPKFKQVAINALKTIQRKYNLMSLTFTWSDRHATLHWLARKYTNITALLEGRVTFALM